MLFFFTNELIRYSFILIWNDIILLSLIWCFITSIYQNAPFAQTMLHQQYFLCAFLFPPPPPQKNSLWAASFEDIFSFLAQFFPHCGYCSQFCLLIRYPCKMDSRKVRRSLYPMRLCVFLSLQDTSWKTFHTGMLCVTVIIDARKLCEGLFVIK